MNKLLLILLGLLAFTSLANSADKEAINDFTESLRRFTASVYRKVAETTPSTDNIFFSPTSIAHTLGMVLSGSAGNTEFEIKRALNIDPRKNYSPLNIRKLFKKVHNKLFNTKRNNTLSKALMASRMYLQENSEVHQSYIDNLAEYFDAEEVGIDFGASQAAADTINDWISNRTGGLITDLISPDSMDALTRMILVNALYFKASWKIEMKKRPNLEEFHTSDNTKKKVQYMSQSQSMHVSRTSGVTQVSIPYDKSEAFLVIMMPHSDLKFGEFEHNLLNYMRNFEYNFSTWKVNRKVKFSMPMFEIEQEMNVKTILNSLQVNDLFDQTACDLSGITSEELSVSEFLHKAKVTVDEKGTIAAAATAAQLIARSSSAGPKVITIDRPFYFGIYRLGHMLFFGRVVDPAPSTATEDNSNTAK